MVKPGVLPTDVARSSFARTALAVTEPVLVFMAATLLSSVLLDWGVLAEWRERLGAEPSMLILRWLPLLLLALILDVALRRRGLAAWGLLTPWRTPAASLAALAALLTVGGLPALGLTLAMEQASAPPPGWAAAFVALLAPLLGQEVFIVGYAQRRLLDGVGRWVAALLVAVLFALAHANHAGAGLLGWAFVAAMAVQGLMWSLARSAGAPLPLLMLAHLLLLLGYLKPLAAVGIILLLCLITIRAWPVWLGRVLRPESTSSNAHAA